MRDVMVLGRNLRWIRQERQLSLGGLAKEAGLAKQTLANLESGNGNPTVDTLLRVADALGVGVNWLVTEWGTAVLVQRGATAAYDDTDGGRRRVLDQTYGSGRVTTALLELASDRKGPATPPLPAGTLHHAYVVSGRVSAGPEHDQQNLQAGDFVRFPGDVPHVLQAMTPQAVVHVVTTVPQVQQFSPG